MKEVVRSIEVARDVRTAWRLVSDLSAYDDVIVGVRRWEPLGDNRYWVLMQVGSVPTGGEVDVTVDPEAHQVSWTSVRGTRHEARISVDDLGEDRCRLTFSLRFRLIGPAAAITEFLAATIVRRNLVASLESARHLIEHELDEAGS